MSALGWLVIVAVTILAIGMSAVTLAQRGRTGCTACKQAHLEIQRDFTMRCVGCGARFQRDGNGLRAVERQG